MKGKRVIKLDEYEYGAVVSIINEKRNNLIRMNRNTDFISEILEKIIKAPLNKKNYFKRGRNEYER